MRLVSKMNLRDLTFAAMSKKAKFDWRMLPYYIAIAFGILLLVYVTIRGI